MKKLVLGFFALLLPLLAIAQDTLPDETVSEMDRDPAAVADKKDSTPVAQKARYRLYSGGQDEQDLQVQTNLPQPQRYSDGQAPVVVKTSGEE